MQELEEDLLMVELSCNTTLQVLEENATLLPVVHGVQTPRYALLPSPSSHLACSYALCPVGLACLDSAHI